jgi:PAS domain S-box-containing protein
VQDITSRKRMEETLRTNEHRLRSILERLPMGLCLVQPDGRISFRNQRYVQICGYTEADVPDVDTWWQRAFPDPAERESVRGGWREAAERAKANDGVIPGAEYTIR